jgi:hypothetical protein
VFIKGGELLRFSIIKELEILIGQAGYGVTLVVGYGHIGQDSPGVYLHAVGGLTLSVLSTCVTKQTKDLRYRDVGPLWFHSFGLTHDDAVCPGKRVVSWINVCNFYRAIKKKKCPFQSCAASSECPDLPDIGGSTATRRSAPKVF